MTTETSKGLQDWIEKQRAEMAKYLSLQPEDQRDPLAVADREARITEWLEARSVPQPWNIAPQIAETRFPLSALDEFAAHCPENVLAPALSTFASALRVERMAETIVNSTVRIFDLISAIKDYSYMDQAPIQDVNLPQSLENTLSMFGSRLNGIHVELDFDENLPSIHAYGSELNQVWTRSHRKCD